MIFFYCPTPGDREELGKNYKVDAAYGLTVVFHSLMWLGR